MAPIEAQLTTGIIVHTGLTMVYACLPETVFKNIHLLIFATMRFYDEILSALEF